MSHPPERRCRRNAVDALIIHPFLQSSIKGGLELVDGLRISPVGALSSGVVPVLDILGGFEQMLGYPHRPGPVLSQQLGLDGRGEDIADMRQRDPAYLWNRAIHPGLNGGFQLFVIQLDQLFFPGDLIFIP